MTNSDNGVALAEEIVHAVAESYRWPVLRPQPKRAVQLSQAQMNALTGTYGAEVGGDNFSLHVTLERRGGTPELYAANSFSKIASRLYAATPLNLFTLSGESLAFTVGDDGRASSVETQGAKLLRKGP
jgi:hypothetical protein